jgi:hypothetical protein
MKPKHFRDKVIDVYNLTGGCIICKHIRLDIQENKKDWQYFCVKHEFVVGDVATIAKKTCDDVTEKV